MTTTRPLKVFLCHASADKPAVRKLYHYLRERKMDPWLDSEKLLPGQNWKAEIPKALLSSDVIIICLSKNSVDKGGYVQKEIKFALDKALEMPEGRIFIIPARLEECDLPESLSAYHYVNLFEEDGYRRLLRSLRLRAEQIGAAKVSAGKDTVPPNADIPMSKEAQPVISAPSIPHKQTPEPQNETAIDVGGNVSGANIIGGNFSQTLKILGIGLLALAILSLGSWGLIQLGSRMFSPTRTETPVATKPLTKTPTFPPTMTASPSPTKTPIPEPTLGIGSTMIGNDGMTLLYVPAGEFKMGSTDADPLAQPNEKPQHSVYLDAFWIDQTEVTNKQYAACVYASQCIPQSNTRSYTHSNYYGNSQFDNYPVIYIDWDMANAYCKWANERLPTVAEWEKSARGTDARIYPWGNTAPNKDLLNYNSIVGDVTKVGSYETGKSFYGAYDMAGNVWEWMSDLYQSDYYATLGEPATNPQGPSIGKYRVLRGGSWGYGNDDVRSASRLRYDPMSFSDSIGFRCAADATP